MDRTILENILADIDAAAFAIVNATTKPHPAVTKVTTGKRVLLFTNKHGSGYEGIVRRRLLEAGKNPNNFELHDLQWGHRIPDSPLIEHKGKTYLQCVELEGGQSKYFMLGREADPANLNLKERHRSSNQGLPPEEEVHVCCYDIAHIDGIVVMNDVAVSVDARSILPLVQ